MAAHKHLRDFFIREGDEIRIQPCLSPVWDTGIALHALAEAGLRPTATPHSARRSGCLRRNARSPPTGGRIARRRRVGGWFFEFENPHYPDVDDTAMVTMALQRLGGMAASAAANRGVDWLLAMQNDDGGWAAFDQTKDRPILEKIPFADHNAMQDPSCPDITGRVLECLGHCGFTHRPPRRPARRSRYIRSQQDAGGGWWGRWGVNFVYGTWQVPDRSQAPSART